MRSFWTESQKKKEKKKKIFPFCFYFLIKKMRRKEFPTSSSQPLLPCTRPGSLGLFNNSNSSSECVKPRNTLYCVWTRSDGQ